jgi:hypothetical protein
MTFLLGGDSATPKPVRGRKIWGVYVAGSAYHVWTKAEVAQLASQGIQGVMPIVVPPQNEKWWTENFGYAVLESLVREAIAWGVPEGSPLCLDVEEFQSAEMTSPADVCHAWQVACAAHKMRNWIYGSESFLRNDHYGLRWVANWPIPTPTNPQLPQGFNAWQYAGNVNGIDLDIFEEHRTYLSPHLEPLSLPVMLIKEAPRPVFAISPAPVVAPGALPPSSVSDVAGTVATPGAGVPGTVTFTNGFGERLESPK